MQCDTDSDTVFQTRAFEISDYPHSLALLDLMTSFFILWLKLKYKVFPAIWIREAEVVQL